MTDLEEANSRLAAWWLAASPYATPSALLEGLREDRKDALRYRSIVGGCPFAETDPCWETKEALDAAIDARNA